ncbi:hypothetical protein [Streptomyces sp. NPDC096193]|uniref:hypothetical protein n=1 Tax=Streptomyces sp. NPDC096193 TaxID=3155821 RepID=UPI00332EEE6B
MHLTLARRLYLLSYTVEKKRFEAVNLQGRGQLLRAAELAEPALDELLDTRGGEVARRAHTAPSAHAHRRALTALAERFDELVPGPCTALRDSFLVSRGVGGGWG